MTRVKNGALLKANCGGPQISALVELTHTPKEAVVKRVHRCSPQLAGKGGLKLVDDVLLADKDESFILSSDDAKREDSK